MATYIKRNCTLTGKDLDEIAVQSLRCKLSMAELLSLFEILNVKYTKEQVEKINEYRAHIQVVTRSYALNY